MAVNLSFIGGAGWQFLDNNANPLSGGKIYTYAAGTTTPLVTYTARDGLTPNSNPIILDAAGRTPQQIWSTEGLLYKYVVADANNVIIRTWDNIGSPQSASNFASAQDYGSSGNNVADVLSMPATSITAGVKIKSDEGYIYEVAASTATDYDLITTGGVKLYVIPVDNQLDLAAFGAVADYTGTPLYDGNDAARITATDNAAPFIAWVKAINRTGAIGYFNGHYGIKTPNTSANRITLTKDMNIIGNGADKSILDFIYEDATGTTYQTYLTANLMLRLVGGGYSAVFSDFTVKATTNDNVIGSVSDISAVYYGKVWGISFETSNGTYSGGFNRITLNRINVERFNYTGLFFTHVSYLQLNNCLGFYNTGSGYWAQACKSFEILGGEFAYNGFEGSPGTGYGVTGSFLIDYMYTSNAYFHNNYRKGLDSHGCLKFICVDCRFEDNAVYHIGLPLAAERLTDKRIIQINRNLFSQAVDSVGLTWLQNIYTIRVANGFTNFGHGLVDMSISALNTTENDYEFSQNTVRGGYRGMNILSGVNSTQYIRFTGVNSTTRIIDNDIDVPLMGDFTPPFSDGYALQLIGCAAGSGNASLIVENNVINCNFPTVRSVGGVDAFGAIISGNPQNWRILNNDIIMQDQYLIGQGGTSAGLTWAGTYRVDMRNNTVVSDRAAVDGTPTKWFGTPANLSLDKAYFDNNVFNVAGTSYVFGWPQGNVTTRRARSPNAYTVGNVVANIVFDKVGTTAAKIIAYTFGNVYTGELTFEMSSAGSATVSGANVYVTATVNQSYVDTDGITKTSVVLTASGAIAANSMLVEVQCISRVTTYGVEKIVWS